MVQSADEIIQEAPTRLALPARDDKSFGEVSGTSKAMDESMIRWRSDGWLLEADSSSILTAVTAVRCPSLSRSSSAGDFGWRRRKENNDVRVSGFLWTSCRRQPSRVRRRRDFASSDFFCAACRATMMVVRVASAGGWSSAWLLYHSLLRSPVQHLTDDTKR